MAWNFNSREPVFLQIANRIRCDILNGKYGPDEQIPAVRQLAFEASVNPNTMQKSLTYLEDEGLLYSKGTIGRFVTSDSEILKKAREKMKKNCMDDLLARAKEAGIGKEELINYIKEADNI